jgi:hypothetical protein
MKNTTKSLPCGGCGQPAYWKILKPIYQKSAADILLTNPKLLYYEYTCPKCKAVTEYAPDYVREIWTKENPGVQIARKLWKLQ